MPFESLGNLLSNNMLLKVVSAKDHFVMADKNLVAIHHFPVLVEKFSY